ncbi:hypothetical protein IC614_09050 [Allosphingosinicella flava]|uniref:Uncharacterized protein n=1 Tax=Allosphingosinicella flava TaxID=2771430 RepID=A0A7T2GIS2_9SPHN|nr:hypothetical protein [Sphingosinicella flava]QPQ54482.1 hypothetical protein IC614_09050 [Sphingosinicella flava]
MRSSALIALLLLGACRNAEEETALSGNASEGMAPTASSDPKASAASRWDLQSRDDGTALVLLAANGSAAVRLFCPAGGRNLVVNVPAFRPVGSEERLSFGSGGSVTALVAGSHGDAGRGGVSGTGPAPSDLDALIAGPVAVTYGSQTSGPLPAPPAAFADRFVAACAGEDAPDSPKPVPPVAASPCMMQGETRLAVAPLRAAGTEPFWAARIEGRCVTYSHPEDQAGTRVWTRYTPGAEGGGTWSGALNGRAFELRLRPEAGCSDGMSDTAYPLAADLLVNGERRRGCAAPL